MRAIVEKGSDIDADRGLHRILNGRTSPPTSGAAAEQPSTELAPEHFRPPPLPRGTSDAHPCRGAV